MEIACILTDGNLSREIEVESQTDAWVMVVCRVQRLQFAMRMMCLHVWVPGVKISTTRAAWWHVASRVRITWRKLNVWCSISSRPTSMATSAFWPAIPSTWTSSFSKRTCPSCTTICTTESWTSRPSRKSADVGTQTLIKKPPGRKIDTQPCQTFEKVSKSSSTTVTLFLKVKICPRSHHNCIEIRSIARLCLMNGEGPAREKRRKTTHDVFAASLRDMLDRAGGVAKYPRRRSSVYDSPCCRAKHLPRFRQMLQKERGLKHRLTLLTVLGLTCREFITQLLQNDLMTVCRSLLWRLREYWWCRYCING